MKKLVLLSLAILVPVLILVVVFPVRAEEDGPLFYLPIIMKARFLTGAVQGIIIDATGEDEFPPPISGAQVCAVGDAHCDTTDTDGFYTLTDVPILTQTLQITATGFATLEQTVKVTYNQTATLNAALSPALSTGEIQVVLIWDDFPLDLDAHLWLPPAIPFHIWHSSLGDCVLEPHACLIRDRRVGYGPETITISQRFSGTYVYAVNLWPDPEPPLSLTQSNARVQVYDDTGLLATFSVPTSGEGEWWHVFDLDGSTGEVIPRNKILSEPGPGPYIPIHNQPLK